MQSSSKLPTSKTPWRICLWFFTGTASLLHQQKSQYRTPQQWPASNIQMSSNWPTTAHPYFWSIGKYDNQYPGIATKTSSTQISRSFAFSVTQQGLPLVLSSSSCCSAKSSKSCPMSWTTPFYLLLNTFTNIHMHQATNATDPTPGTIFVQLLHIFPTYLTKKQLNSGIHDVPFLSSNDQYTIWLSYIWYTYWGTAAKTMAQGTICIQMMEICSLYTHESKPPTQPSNVTSLPQCAICNTGHHPHAIPYVCPCWYFYWPKDCSCLNLNGLYTATTMPLYCPQFHGTSTNCLQCMYLWTLPCAMHQHQQHSTTYSPTQIQNCPILYLSVTPTATNMNTVMNMTAYLPALTRTFWVWNRMWNTYSS